MYKNKSRVHSSNFLSYDPKQNNAKFCMCNIALLNIYSLDSRGGEGGQLIFFTAQFA